AHVPSPRHDLPDRLNQLLGSALLGQVSRSAGPERADRVLVLGGYGQDEDRELRTLALDFAEQIEAVSVGEVEIEHDHIPFTLPEFCQHLPATPRFALNDDVPGLAQHFG